MRKRDPEARVPAWALNANHGTEGIVTWRRRQLAAGFVLYVAAFPVGFSIRLPVLAVLAASVAGVIVMATARRVIRPDREVPRADA